MLVRTSMRAGVRANLSMSVSVSVSETESGSESESESVCCVGFTYRTISLWIGIQQQS